MFKNFRKNNKGMTLLEMTVAISIFSIAILSVMQIFNMSIKGQRSAVVAQNMQESIRYTLEVMSKEIRMAKLPEDNDCVSFLNGDVFDATGNVLYLLNSNDQCVEYFLENGRLKVRRYNKNNPPIADDEAFVTLSNIKVNNLEFKVIENTSLGQPRVTILMDIEAIGQNKNKLKIQTTISARYYE